MEAARNEVVFELNPEKRNALCVAALHGRSILLRNKSSLVNRKRKYASKGWAGWAEEKLRQKAKFIQDFRYVTTFVTKHKFVAQSLQKSWAASYT